MITNADLAEPRIQIIYQLKAKYYSQNKEKYDAVILTNQEEKEKKSEKEDFYK